MLGLVERDYGDEEMKNFPPVEMTFKRYIPWSERRRRKLADDYPQTETVTCMVALAVDEDELMYRLGLKAIGNKSGRAIEAGGLVVVETSGARRAQA